MTGKPKIWPVKSTISPDIVRWPAVISSPEGGVCVSFSSFWTRVEIPFNAAQGPIHFILHNQDMSFPVKCFWESNDQWYLFHRAIERSCAKRCVAKPDFVTYGIDLLVLAISWSLKQNMWCWVKKAQRVLTRFTACYWTSFRSRNRKHLRAWFIFSIS